MTSSVIVLFLLLATEVLGFDEDIELCRSSLGMESKEIPDSSIKASSSYEEVIVGPLNSRIRTERYGGAWCPKAMISRDVYEWLQIDLADLTIVTAVETQGRYGNGQGQEYAPGYMLEYQKRDGDRLWRRYRDVSGQELFKGNNETQTAEMRNLDPFIVARRIRFVPFSHHPRAICMRVEMYGCPWRDGLVSYDMRQGDTRGDDLDFSDFLYDGFQANGLLTDGLGQLTDKRTGHSNFRLDVNNTGRRGFEWIGWKRRGSHSDQVEIQFRFDSVRNFSAVRIHANNMFTREVRIFRSADLHFSIGGRHFDQFSSPVQWVHQRREELDEEARNIEIELDYRLAKFVTLVLHFDARWILISEIDFISELATGNFSEEIEPEVTSRVSTSAVQSATPSPEKKSDWSNERGQHQSRVIDTYTEIEEDEEEEEEEEYEDGRYFPPLSTLTVATSTDPVLLKSYLATLIGTTVAVVIVTAVACFLLWVWYKRRIALSGCKYSSPFGKSVFVVERCRLDPSNVTTTSAPGDGDNDTTPVQGRLLCHDKRGSGSTMSRLEERSITQGMISDQLMRDLLANETSRPCLPPLPPDDRLPEMGDMERLCAESMVDIDDPSGGTLVRFPTDRFRTIEKLGEGSYTEIRVCELSSLMTSDDHRALVSDVTDVVILKSLKHGASIQNRSEFAQEINRALRFNHRNIIRFFGLTGSDGCLAMVLEYSKYGTLHQYLQQRTTVINTSDISTKYQTPFSHGYLIYMATEIASGMKYLESCGLVHRDLATRNCLVSNELTIKVTDVASACHRYSNHYYHITGNRATLPIRWMAWESVLLRDFSSSKSDIWAFGVTLWEILTCARTLPFDHLSNQQVIDNCCHYYQSDGLHQRLPQPTGCTKEVYDLMVECWNREADQRPTFKEIHLFLSRKNLGFNPRDEQNVCGFGNRN